MTACPRAAPTEASSAREVRVIPRLAMFAPATNHTTPATSNSFSVGILNDMRIGSLGGRRAAPPWSSSSGPPRRPTAHYAEWPAAAQRRGGRESGPGAAERPGTALGAKARARAPGRAQGGAHRARERRMPPRRVERRGPCRRAVPARLQGLARTRLLLLLIAPAEPPEVSSASAEPTTMMLSGVKSMPVPVPVISTRSPAARPSLARSAPVSSVTLTFWRSNVICAWCGGDGPLATGRHRCMQAGRPERTAAAGPPRRQGRLRGSGERLGSASAAAELRRRRRWTGVSQLEGDLVAVDGNHSLLHVLGRVDVVDGAGRRNLRPVQVPCSFWADLRRPRLRSRPCVRRQRCILAEHGMKA